MSRTQSENTLHIQMFAHFQLMGMGNILDEDGIRSDMLNKLLAYIICHRKKELSIPELVDALWHDEESDNPAGALKNLVYRLRTILKKFWPDMEFILTGRGAYRWNMDIPMDIDVELFEAYCDKAATMSDVDQKIDTYLEAIELYKGSFFPKIASEYWVAPLATYYHSMYLSAVKATALLLEQKQRYKEMEHMCNYALKLDNLDESLHCYFIQAMAHQNKLKLALEHYKKAVGILYENLGVSPSEELRNVYEQLLKQTHEEEKNLTVIQKELDDDAEKGAFLCEYGVFKRTYHLEKRRAERMGISVYLSLITVVPTIHISQENQAYLNIVNAGMDQLQQVLLTSLRSGDVISKYSGTQFIVMLPACQHETAMKVMKRIENAFDNAAKKKQKVKLKYTLGEMGVRI